ncbi:MAG: alpha-glucosidase [Peptostreptococcaceae bacterium]|nr:alpha-glucosidase [Peptostreptococcaceae bacterium]
MKKTWWKESVVYQIYPRSFMDSDNDGIGDIKGITSKLDYLKNLGIDVIWLSPVFKSPNDDNGYDISDYEDIMDEFGTMSDFDELLSEAHNRGIKIIMDLVVNHSSDEHKWFVEARKSKDNPYRDYYIWRDGKDGSTPNNWDSIFSGSAWEYDEETNQYFLHLFSKKQPDLNWENENLRQAVYSMMKFWLDKGIDGFRMDVCNLFSKAEGLPDIGEEGPEGIYMNGPKIHDYLHEMNKEVLSKYDIMTVGETPGVSPKHARDYVGEDRDELNMVFHFELMDLPNASDKFYKKPYKLTDIKNIFMKWYDGLENIGWNSLFMNNHDQPRMVSRFGNDSKYRIESAKMLATLIHTFKGTPYIYQGEEIGMTNICFDDIKKYRDIETINYYNEKIKNEDEKSLIERIKITSRDNARTPMQWDNNLNGGFSKATPWIDVNPNYKQINVKESLEDSNSIFNYYKELIKLRHNNDTIVYGDVKLIYPENESIFAYTRNLDDEQLMVVLNFYENEIDFKIPDNIDIDKLEIILSNYKDKVIKNETIKLRPYEAIVYKVK